ncbi:MAG: hypothetical protein JW982_01475 [Spirochaetes bacterium]|nr:hypothetical protein [Spirochaetota bacterium]
MKSVLIENNFRSLLRKYRFQNDLPAEVKKSVAADKSKNLKIILKDVDNYSVSFGILISVYYLLKKTGINLSIAWIKTILLSSLIISVAVPASLITYKVYFNSVNMDKNKKEFISAMTHDSAGDIPAKTDKKETEAIENGKTDKNLKVQKKSENTVLLKINKFEFFNSEEIPDVEGMLFSELSSFTEKGAVILNLGDNRTESKYILTGRVIRLDQKYSLTVKLYNAENSELEYVNNRTFNRMEDLHMELQIISEEIKNRKILK